jgi:hypothetical protein
MALEKKRLSPQGLEAQTALELPDRHTLRRRAHVHRGEGTRPGGQNA